MNSIAIFFFDDGLQCDRFIRKTSRRYMRATLYFESFLIITNHLRLANVSWPNTAPHNFAMAAKNTMTQTLAFKYRNDNVRVNGVLAGVIHTGALDVMAKKKNKSVESYAATRATAQPLGRNGTPDDVANAVVFFASPASGFTTGELLRVDGGLHLSNWWNQQAMLNKYSGETKGEKNDSTTSSTT